MYHPVYSTIISINPIRHNRQLTSQSSIRRIVLPAADQLPLPAYKIEAFIPPLRVPTCSTSRTQTINPTPIEERPKYRYRQSGTWVSPTLKDPFSRLRHTASASVQAPDKVHPGKSQPWTQHLQLLGRPRAPDTTLSLLLLGIITQYVALRRRRIIPGHGSSLLRYCRPASGVGALNSF